MNPNINLTSPPASSFDVRESVAETLRSVFDTMLAMKVESVAADPPPHFADRVTGSVGFAGESVTGAVYLHLSSVFARQVAAAMLGTTPDQVGGDGEVNDVVGEVCNMLAGALKSRLCDDGVPCAISTPCIIRGTSFQIQALPEVRLERLAWICQDQRIAAEIHIKFS